MVIENLNLRVVIVLEQEQRVQTQKDKLYHAIEQEYALIREDFVVEFEPSQDYDGTELGNDQTFQESLVRLENTRER